MSTNLATIIGGPCLIQYDGSTFRSKGDVRLDLALETFDVVTDLYQAVDKRVSGQPVRVTFTPEGRFADLSVLFPYLGATLLGSFITPRYECGTVDATANTIAIAATTLPAATPVSFGTTETMPGGVTAATLYYLSANSAGVRTIHNNATDAGTGANPVNITSTGSGTLTFVIQKALVILGTDGTRVTLHNAALTRMPTLTLRSTETLWGEVEFEAFSKNGVPWTTANSIYTIDTATFSDSGFDPADILTQPYVGEWGSAPWNAFYTKEGFTVEPALELVAVDDDRSGVLTRQIAGLGVTARGQPHGPGLADLMSALTLQGGGATRGRSLAGSNLNITGTGVYVRLYSAALIGGPAQWSTRLNRLGELTWAANRTFSGGAPQPLLYVGSSAPA